jgi:hypothetical protein
MENLPIDIINKIFEYTYNNRIVKMDPKNKSKYLVVFSSFEEYNQVSDLYKSIKLYSNKKYNALYNNFIYWFEISSKKWVHRYISNIDENAIINEKITYNISRKI